MKLENLLPKTEAEKACIWDIFRAEDKLWDIESELLEDQRYYETRLKSIGTPDTAAEQALSTIYENHLRRIRSLLARLPQQRPLAGSSLASSLR